MKTPIQIMGLISAMALCAAMGCSPLNAAPDPAADQAALGGSRAAGAPGTQATASTTEAKVSAPIDVSLTSSASSGTVVVTLTLMPRADIPRGVARIVLPDKVRLVSGQTQVDLGALKRGAVMQHQVTVEVPSTGQFRIFAGVDCHISSGILIHKGASELVLGR